MNFDRATNPHPTDFAYEICIRRMRILAGSVTSLVCVQMCEWECVNVTGIHFGTMASSLAC